jgi:hypothetical protein
MFTWSSTCFGRHTAHHQELKTALAVSGFLYVKGCWTCSWWTLSGTVCLTTSWFVLWCTDPPTSRHVKFKVFSNCFTQEHTSRCVTRTHRVCSVISLDKVPSLLRYSLFWDITSRILLFIYRVYLFMSDCLSLKTEPVCFTEKSVNNFYSCTVHSAVIQSFISPTNAQPICFKILKFTLKYTINPPTCFGLTKLSLGSLQSVLC